jgi:hypothetical protein
VAEDDVIVGVAVARSTITAALPDGTIWTGTLDPSIDQAPVAVLAALRELRTRVADRRAVLRIALLPPLVQGRRLELPRLAADEYRGVLARNAARYFATDGTTQVAGPIVIRRGPRSLVFATIASAGVIEQLLQAAHDAGWRRATVIPAYAAWAAGAAQETAVLALPDGSETTLLGVTAGRPAWVRRLPSAAEADLAAVAQRECAIEGEGRAIAGVDDPAALAARGARLAGEPELVPEQRHLERRIRARRVTLRLLSAILLLLLADSGLRLLDVKRELAAMRAERAEVRQAVGAALATRDSLTALEARVTVLRELEATAPRWTTVFGVLAGALPRDAYVVSVRAAGDTVVLGGLAKEAAGVLAGLQDAGAFRAVRAEAPIRRELVDGETAVERFTVSVRVGSDAAP